MCMFTGPVISVSTTRIFARAGKGDEQFLVYRMSFEADQSVAMVLPLPVKHGSGEKAVKFINLEEYPDFFLDVERGFPQPPVTMHSDRRENFALAASALEVVPVGDFEASFVPTLKDFSRLDGRFRLPENAWKILPGYKDYGFAVFKLKPGKQDVHPMAFSFPRREATLFYPTVHLHDGKIHTKAHFDHVLYGQPSSDSEFIFHGWTESTTHVVNFVKLDKAQGIVEPHQHCYKKEMRGNLKNQDTVINCSS